MSIKKLLLILFLVVITILYFFTDIGAYMTPSYLQQLYAQQPVITALVFMVAYILLCSFPVAALLTVMGGMVFGLAAGTLMVSFASSIGATLMFLVSRGLLHNWVQHRFGRYLEAVNRGVERDGAFYLFTLRLIPAIPFFAINPVMGLTRMKATTFYWVSQLGMLPATMVYVNAGAELGAVEELSLQGILTPGLWFSFILLASFPFVARAIVNTIKRRQLYKEYQRPDQFDTNLAVVGAGSAGLVSAYIAAAVKADVTLIEKHKMGGDCLNTGCVPSKALIRAAKAVHAVKEADRFGVEVAEPRIDFSKVMAHVQQAIAAIEPNDSVARYTELGVECLSGNAELISPWSVVVDGREVRARSIIIASGARPLVPPIPGLDSIDYLTSDNLWEVNELPKRLLVLGGGPIGCELAQAFQRLGSEVTLVDMMPRLLPREDEDVSAFVAERFNKEGIRVLTGHKTVAFERRGDRQFAVLDSSSAQVECEFDRVLVAVGRKANVEQLGLEQLGIELTPQRTIAVDEYLATRIPNIYACGDVVGPYQFTHVASHQAWYATVNALFAPFKRFKVDYSVIPWATFVDPEVARVGLNEADAKAQGIDYEVTRYSLDDLDRAIADGEAQGFVKVLTRPGSDKILGATIVGYHASDLITEFVTAMKRGIGLNKILGTIHIYPTVSEANKYTAGAWKRAHKPEALLKWVEKFHGWRRG